MSPLFLQVHLERVAWARMTRATCKSGQQSESESYQKQCLRCCAVGHLIGDDVDTFPPCYSDLVELVRSAIREDVHIATHLAVERAKVDTDD